MDDKLGVILEAKAKEIVDIAFQIHKKLGPGLLESVYESCFFYELEERGFICERQKQISLEYEGLTIDNAYKIDLLVDDEILIELKAQEGRHPIWEAQLISYLKLTGNRLGFLINFHVPLIKDGIKRIIL